MQHADFFVLVGESYIIHRSPVLPGHETLQRRSLSNSLSGTDHLYSSFRASSPLNRHVLGTALGTPYHQGWRNRTTSKMLQL